MISKLLHFKSTSSSKNNFHWHYPVWNYKAWNIHIPFLLFKYKKASVTLYIGYDCFSQKSRLLSDSQRISEFLYQISSTGVILCVKKFA